MKQITPLTVVSGTICVLVVYQVDTACCKHYHQNDPQ